MSVPSVNSYRVVVSNEMGMMGSVGKQTGSLLKDTQILYVHTFSCVVPVYAIKDLRDGVLLFCFKRQSTHLVCMVL